MKLCVKKIFCSNCQRLVECREQTTNTGTQILCSRCGKPIWIHEGVRWRYVKST